MPVTSSPIAAFLSVLAALSLLCAPAAAPARAQAKPAKPTKAAAQDAKALALLNTARTRYAALKSLRYASRVTVTQGKEKGETIRLDVTVSRPASVALVARPTAASAPPTTTLTGNGKQLFVYDPARKSYLKDPTPADRPVPALLPFYALTAMTALDPAVTLTVTPDQKVSLGKSETIGGVRCREVVRISASGQQEVRLWLPENGGDGLARRAVVVSGAGEEKTRAEEEVASLSINPSVPASTYVWKVPADAANAALLNVVPPSLTPGGTIADFTLKNQNGDEWKLSKQRGKPTVIFLSLTVGRGSLRAIDYAQGLYEKLGGKNGKISVAVIDVGSAEDIPARNAFLKGNPKLTLPILLDDAKGEASIARSRFKLERIPSVYVLDKDGKILAGYTGWGDPIAEQIEAALKSLKVL